ncbi:MAG TPA: ATP-grasp domain-containing protein [Mycobacteriales bacterium]|nr:ATP-grasp domain-containing protein [Mycobacteriales bacterium]
MTADAVVLLGAMFAARYPNLVPAATRRGLTVLGIDSPTPGHRRYDTARRENAGHPLAGVAELAWLAGDRHEEVLDQVIRWQRDHRVRAVVAVGEDFVEAAGVVTDYLGLPSPGLRASRVCRNKLLQRRYQAEHGPVSWLLPPADRLARAQEWTDFPAVVKPLRGEASSGVRRVVDRAELLATLGEYDADEPVLLEQLVTGHEISVESLVQGGEVRFASATGKRTNERGGTYFVEMGHTAPDPGLAEPTRAAVLATNAAVLRRLAFADGIAHAEYRIGAGGRVYLMEVAARAAGDSILTLYHLATGQPMEEALLAIALGEPVSYPAPTRYARQVYLEHQPGVLADVTVDGLDTAVTWLSQRWMWPAVTPRTDKLGTIHMIVAGRDRGAELGEIRQSSDRSVMYVIDAATPAELDALEARCAKAITIEMRSG